MDSPALGEFCYQEAPQRFRKLAGDRMRPVQLEPPSNSPETEKRTLPDVRSLIEGSRSRVCRPSEP